MGAGSDREWVPCSATERGRSDPRSGTSRDGVVREGEVGWRESNPSAERRLKRRESNNNNKKRRKPKTTSYYKMTDLVCECRSSCDENDPRHTVRVSPSPHPSPLTTATRSPNRCPLWNLLFAACLPGEGWGVGAARTPSTRPSRVLIPTPWWNIYPPRQPSVVVVESADSFPFLIDLIVAPTDSKVRKHGGWPSESGGGR